MSALPALYADECARKYARRLWFRTGPHDPYNPTIPKLYRAAYDVAYLGHVKACCSPPLPATSGAERKGE